MAFRNTDAGEGLARVGEDLPFAEGDVEEPLVAAVGGQSGCGPRAVVEDAGNLVDDEVFKRGIQEEVGG